jgi:hypothetical protein
MRAVVARVGGRRAWRLLVLAECLILGVFGLGAVEAHAATPSSLAGETLTGNSVVEGPTVTGTCAGHGNEGSFKFSVSGSATGPFPGTFKESGSFTTSPSGVVNGFSSTFTITSAAGPVTGSKLLAGSDGIATCSQSGSRMFVSTSAIPTAYTATINGAQRNTGTATVSLAGLLGVSVGLTFSESFTSPGVVQLTIKEQCKNGGWQSFGFKNQGGCVSFVATGGKNPPSES